MSAPELKPCPFCGGEARLLTGLNGCGLVACAACSAEVDGHNRPEAIAAWNTRADVSAAREAAAREEGRREGLEEAARFVETHAYMSSADVRAMEPSRFPGMDQHHATIAAAIRALTPPADLGDRATPRRQPDPSPGKAACPTCGHYPPKHCDRCAEKPDA